VVMLADGGGGYILLDSDCARTLLHTDGVLSGLDCARVVDVNGRRAVILYGTRLIVFDKGVLVFLRLREDLFAADLVFEAQPLLAPGPAAPGLHYT
jgi:hypothetical protein